MRLGPRLPVAVAFLVLALCSCSAADDVAAAEAAVEAAREELEARKQQLHNATIWRKEKEENASNATTQYNRDKEEMKPWSDAYSAALELYRAANVAFEPVQTSFLQLELENNTATLSIGGLRTKLKLVKRFCQKGERKTKKAYKKKHTSRKRNENVEESTKELEKSGDEEQFLSLIRPLSLSTFPENELENVEAPGGAEPSKHREITRLARIVHPHKRAATAEYNCTIDLPKVEEENRVADEKLKVIQQALADGKPKYDAAETKMEELSGASDIAYDKLVLFEEKAHKSNEIMTEAEAALGRAKVDEVDAQAAVEAAGATLKKCEAELEEAKKEAPSTGGGNGLMYGAIGGGIALLLAVAAIVGFVIFKKQQNKKKKEEDEKPTETRAPNGLTMRTKKNGEVRYVVKAEDFIDKGPVVHQKYPKDLEIEHAVKDEDGVNKIPEIYFDPSHNEVRYIGPGVEVVPDESTTSVSTKGGTEDNDKAPTIPDLPPKTSTSKKEKSKKEKSKKEKSKKEKSNKEKSKKGSKKETK